MKFFPQGQMADHGDKAGNTTEVTNIKQVGQLHLYEHSNEVDRIEEQLKNFQKMNFGCRITRNLTSLYAAFQIRLWLQ
jgi:hypothetical protein